MGRNYRKSFDNSYTGDLYWDSANVRIRRGLVSTIIFTGVISEYVDFISAVKERYSVAGNALYVLQEYSEDVSK